MASKQKIGIAITGIVLGFAGIILSPGKSTANTVLVSKHHRTQIKPAKLANLEVGNNKSISCLVQQRSPLINAVELLMRLLIIGSFGSVSIAGSSSVVQRYLHIINRDYVFIVYCAVGLVLILVMSSVIILISPSRFQLSTPSCYKNIAISFNF